MTEPSVRVSTDPAAPLLVGRARELATLHTALDTAAAGRGGLVLIGGTAGLGKTTLAEALLTEATARGQLVLIGRCYDLSETSPYGPWREVCAHAPSDAATHFLAALSDGEVSAISSQAALHQQMHDALAALATQQSLVILLDDLHWADPASLDLLRFLARGLSELSLLLLVTYRSDELTRRHLLYALLPTLVREARALRLDLRPLENADIHALVRRYGLPTADEERLVAHVQGRAEGNPFYAGELLRALEEERTLHPHGTAWQLGDIAGTRVPPLLRQVLDGRLDRLGEATRALLAVAAVIGQEVRLDLWAVVAETDEEALIISAEQAIEAHVLMELADGSVVHFAHALIREVLYQGMGALRRRALHRRVADALLAAAHPDPDAVAYHLRQASDPRAARWLVLAGDRARRTHALMTAGERYEAALALLETAGADAGERGWLAFRLARTYWLADPQRSLAELAQAAPLAEQAADRALSVSIALEHGFLLCVIGQMRRGLAEIEAVVPVIEALPVADRARLTEGHDAQFNPRGLLAEWFAWTGRFADALAMGKRIVPEAPLDMTARDIPYSAYANAYLGLAVAHAGQGRPEEARRAFAAARACNLAIVHSHQLGMNARQELGWVVLPYQTERMAERQLLAEETEQAWRRASGARPEIIPASAALPLMLLEGRWAEAHAVATELHASRSSGWSRIVANNTLASLAYERGDLTEAWARATEDLADGPDTEPGDTWILDALPVQRLAALIAVERGEYPAARAWLVCHDRWLDWADATLGRAEAALCWATYHRATGAAAPAREQAELALARATQPRQPLALLAAHRLLGSLDSEARRYDAAVAHLDAALALAEACAAPYARALTLLDFAELRLALGKHAEGQAAIDEARPILVALGAKPALARVDALVSHLATPPIVQTTALPFGLTLRETEVVRLVAQGLTDLQIADQLFVSRHTVNSHLKAIYGKLGVTSRAAAPRLALEHHLT